MADRTAQDLLVQEQIAFLLQQQFEHMNANKGEGDNSDDYFRWQRHIEDIHDQYREARDKEDAKGKYEKATKSIQVLLAVTNYTKPHSRGRTSSRHQQ